MNKFFDKFLKVNKKIIFPKKKFNGYAVLIDRKRYVSAIYSSLATAAACKKYNLKPLVITDNFKLGYKKIYESFGIEKFFKGFSYYSILENIFVLLHSLLSG